MKGKEMRRRLFLTSLALALTCFSVQAQGVLKFEKLTHDFGTVDVRRPVSYSFKFTNTGKSPLVIQRAYGMCGCTVPTYTKEPILPGKEGVVTVTYNGSRQRSGNFTKSVTVCSDAENKVVRLFIKGVNARNEK